MVREYWKGNQIWIIHQSKEKLIRNIHQRNKDEVLLLNIRKRPKNWQEFFLFEKMEFARIFVYEIIWAALMSTPCAYGAFDE